MKPTPEQLAAFARWNGQTRGTPWAQWKAIALNAIFDAAHAGQNATVSNIQPETVRHGEAK